MASSRCLYWCFIMVFLIVVSEAQNRQFWVTQGLLRLNQVLRQKPNEGVARNVILFLGDGMGVSTITAARILKGQIEGGTGEEYQLNMEKFPYSGLIKTYNTDAQTPDSAGTATAFLSGVKTRIGLIGVDEHVQIGNCSAVPSSALDTILDWSLAEGKSVGIVSTARITHATPAAAYAHVADRDWESDVDISSNCAGSIKDIARQLVEDNEHIQVILGGGRRAFYNSYTPDPGTASLGRRIDGRNLVDDWESRQALLGRQFKYVTNNDEFKSVGENDVDSLLGLFNPSHMEYEVDRTENGSNSQPSISEMTAKAIRILKKNTEGFFLLVEGGRVDMAHHSNQPSLSLTEAIAMDDAIKTAMDLTSEQDTLILVTADHSHVFNIAGYPPRGNPILGKIPHQSGSDGLPMTTLIYGNGPGPGRSDLSEVDTTATHFVFPNAVPLSSETHGGEDVVVFARGPMSHLVTGVNEQSFLAYVMGYAACVGPEKSHCGGADIINLSTILSRKRKR